MRTPLIGFERWDVGLSPFPFSEKAGSKRRPVVVLSSSGFNRGHGLLVTSMITTAAHGRWPSDHELIDLASAGLTRSCVVRWKIFTLASTIISRRIGTIGAVDRAGLQTKLDSIFPLEDA